MAGFWKQSLQSKAGKFWFSSLITAKEAVQHIPRSTSRHSLGTGKVLGKRKLGKRWQVLVQLHETGQSLWLPYERLSRIKDAALRYIRQEKGLEDSAERFRLKFLAHALESFWQLELAHR